MWLGTLRSGRLRHQLALHPLECIVCRGRVTPRGSLRALKHFRGKQLVEEVDAYDLLLHEVRSDMRRLENGDTLARASSGTAGDSGRNGSAALLSMSCTERVHLRRARTGGWNPSTATLRHIEVQRVEAHEKRTMLSLISHLGGR